MCMYILVTEKNRQGTPKLHVQFCIRISRSQRPHNENWYVHYSLRACSMVTNAPMSQLKFMRGLGTCVLFASVAGSPHLFKEFACAISNSNSNSVFIALNLHLKTDSKQKPETIIINLRHSKGQHHGEKPGRAKVRVDMLV